MLIMIYNHYLMIFICYDLTGECAALFDNISSLMF